MSNLIEYAKSEMDAAGLTDDRDEYNVMVRKAVLEIMGKFAEQGHSGFSAGVVTSILGKVMRFEPLTPLTGSEDEWVEVTDGCFQNRRCSRVFRENGEAYDIEGRVFEDADGSRWTNGDSRVPVVFPYVPSREVVQRTS